MTFEDFESEYADLVSDVMNARFEFYEARLRDFLGHLDASEWSKGAVKTLSDGFDFSTWYQQGTQTTRSMVGKWLHELGSRSNTTPRSATVFVSAFCRA